MKESLAKMFITIGAGVLAGTVAIFAMTCFYELAVMLIEGGYIENPERFAWGLGTGVCLVVIGWVVEFS